MSSIFINKQQFELYLGCSKTTALKKYSLYLDLAEKNEKQQLTIYDLSRIDALPLDEVKSILGFQL